MTVETLIPVAYLIAAVTFVLGLKGLSSPTTAVQGNRIAIYMKEMTRARDFTGGTDERDLQTLSFRYRIALKENR